MPIQANTTSFKFLNNRNDALNINVKQEDVMLVLYRELMEYDVYRWAGSAYQLYEHMDGVGVDVENDVVVLHFADSSATSTINGSQANSEAVTAYGASNWELELYRSSMLGEKYNTTLSDAWAELLSRVFIEPTPHDVSGLSPDDHVRSKHFTARELMKPYLGLGGNKGEEVDYIKLARDLHAPETAVKTSSFMLQDGGHYYIEHPISKGVESHIDQLYTYLPSIVVNASHDTSNAHHIFQNNPDGTDTSNSGFWTTGWSSHNENSAKAGRLIIDLGEEVTISGMEWQGLEWTGYTSPNGPKPISGPRSTTLRFSTVPFTSTVNGQAGNVANISKTWANLDVGANTSTSNGLAEFFDLRSANGGSPITCRYIAIDMNTSWDTRNMGMRHVLFHEQVPVVSNPIVAVVTPEVASFTIQDSNGNTNEGSPTDIVFGKDTMRLGLASVGVSYHARRIGDDFYVVGTDGSVSKKSTK